MSDNKALHMSERLAQWLEKHGGIELNEIPVTEQAYNVPPENPQQNEITVGGVNESESQQNKITVGGVSYSGTGSQNPIYDLFYKMNGTPVSFQEDHPRNETENQEQSVEITDDNVNEVKSETATPGCIDNDACDITDDNVNAATTEDSIPGDTSNDARNITDSDVKHDIENSSLDAERPTTDPSFGDETAVSGSISSEAVAANTVSSDAFYTSQINAMLDRCSRAMQKQNDALCERMIETYRTTHAPVDWRQELERSSYEGAKRDVVILRNKVRELQDQVYSLQAEVEQERELKHDAIRAANEAKYAERVTREKLQSNQNVKHGYFELLELIEQFIKSTKAQSMNFYFDTESYKSDRN